MKAEFSINSYLKHQFPEPKLLSARVFDDTRLLSDDCYLTSIHRRIASRAASVNYLENPLALAAVHSAGHYISNLNSVWKG